MLDNAEKKYVNDNAQLMAEWNWKRNSDFQPAQLTLGSGKNVWWKCEKNHEWEDSINHRNNGRGCPYCSGKRILSGYNDLLSINPKLAAEWDYENNIGLTPIDISPNSHKKVWWKCDNGHKWQATIKGRNHGVGCPYCSGRYAVKEENDLQTLNPKLASEWNYKKNILSPTDVKPNSSKKVWWECENGHEWQASIGSRHRGNSCPYCSGRNAIKGKTDLQTINPALASEWYYEKNNGLTPADVLPNSNKKMWWKCKKGHEWQAIIADRTIGHGCPICNSERKTSLPEYALLYYLKKHKSDTIHSYKERGYELDIYIPSMKIAVEYDGYFWHKNKEEKDLEKNLKCSKDGIKLYRIREGLPSLNSSSIDYIIQKRRKDLSEALKNFLHMILGISIDVDLERDTIEIENLREHIEKENSLLHANPNLTNEWNYEKNANLRPEHFYANSNKKIWWKCSKGHEWKASINDRHNGKGCPFCCGKKVLIGYNDLITIVPSLSSEWNYEKNGDLKPENFTAGSNKKIWWKCNKGHEWRTSIDHRANGTGCPYCAGQKVINGINDLKTVNPTLAYEWNYEKNDSLTPIDVMPNSHKKVWWKCKNGHEWQAIIAHRNNGQGCPYCSGRKR